MTTYEQLTTRIECLEKFIPTTKRDLSFDLRVKREMLLLRRDSLTLIEAAHDGK